MRVHIYVITWILSASFCCFGLLLVKSSTSRRAFGPSALTVRSALLEPRTALGTTSKGVSGLDTVGTFCRAKNDSNCQNINGRGLSDIKKFIGIGDRNPYQNHLRCINQTIQIIAQEVLSTMNLC